MAAPSAFTVLERSEHVVIGLWHNCFVTVWRSSATLEAMRRVGEHHRQLDERFTGGLCALAVISVASVRMDAEIRAEATRLSENPGENMTAIAQVILGTGLGAATTRMIASGLMLVRKRKLPSKLFSDVASAARWLTPYLKGDAPGTRPDINELIASVEELRAR
jgi:hypothetical protein